MPHLFGKNISRKDLEARVSRMEQIAGVRRETLVGGREDGVKLAQVYTGSGLRFGVNLSRGMDIHSADFCGRSLCWQSVAGPVAPTYFEPEGIGWLRTFAGGLITTCGLTYIGDPNVDEGWELGLHGRIAHIPADKVQISRQWQGEDYVLTITGEMVEALPVVGEHLRLTRTITARMGESRFFLQDTVENFGYKSVPHMLLYHINTGWPLLEANSRIIAPITKTIPRTDFSLAGADRWDQGEAPQVGFMDQDFYHHLTALPDGQVKVAMVNPDLDACPEQSRGGGMGLYIGFVHEQLPRLVEWKLCGAGTYVIATEPANSWVEGRAVSRAQKDLIFLEPGETREYDIEFGVVSGETAIVELENKIQQMH
jgi:hypothetical protein